MILHNTVASNLLAFPCINLNNPACAPILQGHHQLSHLTNLSNSSQISSKDAITPSNKSLAFVVPKCD
jgi:hypothetical protein